jgi:hypothetical protein
VDTCRYHGRHEQGSLPHGLTGPQRAALELLTANHRILPGPCWMVGRSVAQPLIQQGLVVATPGLVLFTQAGAQALAEERGRPRDQSNS